VDQAVPDPRRRARALLLAAASAVLVAVVALVLGAGRGDAPRAAAQPDGQRLPSPTAVREWLADMRAVAPRALGEDPARALGLGLASCPEAEDPLLDGRTRIARVEQRFGVDGPTADAVYEINYAHLCGGHHHADDAVPVPVD
jgi:hypothetical protein